MPSESADHDVGAAQPLAPGPGWLHGSPSGHAAAAPRLVLPRAHDLMYVTSRTIRIGHETYPLRNIARVTVRTVEWAERPPLREVGPPVLLLLLAVLGLATTSRSYQEDGLRSFCYFVAAVGLLWLIVAIARRRYRTALVIETSGRQSTALISKHEAAAYALENEVVDAIENPPAEPRTVQIGDVVHGDKVGGNKYQQRPDDLLSGPPGGRS